MKYRARSSEKERRRNAVREPVNTVHLVMIVRLDELHDVFLLSIDSTFSGTSYSFYPPDPLTKPARGLTLRSDRPIQTFSKWNPFYSSF